MARVEEIATKGLSVPVDFLIPTFNEETNLPHTLRSVMGWANRVFVLDSGSTDRTQEIAREMGAEVIEHPWEGYARQKNWGLDNLPFESPWIFILDADEVVTPELRDELIELCSKDPDAVPCEGFYVNRYLVFMGKRIGHCGYYPSWNLRLFKRGSARYEERPVHEHMLVDGREGYLRGLMAHEDRRGLEYYIAKHNRYSTLEAEVIFHGERNGQASLPPRLLGNAVQRRRYFKTRIYPRLPAKWLGRFIWMYFLRFGFLDGLAGLRFCLLISSHELFTSLKLRELQHQAKQNQSSIRDTTNVQLTEQPIRLPDSTGNTAGSAIGNGEPIDMDSRSDPAEAVVRKEASPWTFGENVKRVLWMVVSTLLFRPSFHNWYGWRRFLLRAFGARIGRDVRIRPSAQIEIPWHLDIGDETVIGDYAILYSLGRIRIGRQVVISQYAHLCAGTHDYTSRRFPLLRPPIRIEDEAWIAADAFVGPGVTVGPRAVVGARASAIKDVPPDHVVAGTPARFIKMREMRD